MASFPNPLARILRNGTGALGAVVLFSMVINLLALTVPLHMMHVYDHVLTSRSGPTLLFIGILAFGLLLVLGALELVRSRILVRLGNRVDRDLGPVVVQASIAAQLSRRSGASQASRDMETLRMFLSGGALAVLFDAPWAPIFIAVTFPLHPWLGLVALVGAVVLLAVALLNELTTRRLSRAGTQNSLAAQGFLDSSLRNAEVISAMGMMPGVTGRWRSWHDRAIGFLARSADRSAEFTAGAKFWRPFLQVAMLSTGAWLAIEQTITAGSMIAASIIMGRALAPVEGAIGSWRTLLAARGAYARLHSLLQQQGQRPPATPLPAPSGHVSVTGLVAAAAPGSTKPLLRGISFELVPGECLGVIGPSAAGKSTLARAVLGIIPALSGEVRLDGALLDQWQPEHLGPHVGYLPQDIELFDGTVADNIGRFSHAAPGAIIAAATLVGVHDMILRLPSGYDTPIGPGGETLSGGQRQLVGLARAVLGHPRLVVLDEPNSNLDAEGEDKLRQALLALKADRATVIVIAHRPNIITVADKVLVMRDGAVEMFGPRASVLARVTRPVPQDRPTAAGMEAAHR